MGQKVHPYGFRLGYNKDWHSHWYAKKQFGEFLLEDLKLKKDLKEPLCRRRRVARGYRARCESPEDHHLHLASGNHHRSQEAPRLTSSKGDLSAKTGREVLVSIQEIHKPELERPVAGREDRRAA